MMIKRLKPYLIPIGLTLLACLIALAGSAPWHWLRYDRQAILNGELWRLLSGHLTHLNLRHLAMNLTGLALIWALVGRQYSNSQWLLALIWSGLCISAGLMIFNPELHWYVGLSGILHGLLVAGCIRGIWGGTSDKPILVVLMVLVIAKLAWEQLGGALPGSEATAGGQVIVDAHLYGAISGALLAVYWQLIRRGNDAPLI